MRPICIILMFLVFVFQTLFLGAQTATVVSNISERILSTGVVLDSDVASYAKYDNKTVQEAILSRVSRPTNNVEITAKIFLSQKLNIPVTPKDYLIGMAWAESPAVLRSRRSLLNKLIFNLAVADARKNGKPTVGVVIEKYQAVIAAANDGTNFVKALSDLDVDFPFDWDGSIAGVDTLIGEILSGVIVTPTTEHLARIELYKGIAGFNAFVRQYNSN